MSQSFVGIGLVDPRNLLETVRQSASVQRRPYSAHCATQKDRAGEVSTLTELLYARRLDDIYMNNLNYNK